MAFCEFCGTETEAEKLNYQGACVDCGIQKENCPFDPPCAGCLPVREIDLTDPMVVMQSVVVTEEMRENNEIPY